MNFKNWILIENQKELIKAYRDEMRNTPENIHHHPEGDSWSHVKLVYRAILGNAQKELQELKSNSVLSDILKDIDLTIDSEEQKILNLVAFLHDIAKPTTFSVDKQRFLFPLGREIQGKVQAIGHEDPKQFVPVIEKYRKLANNETQTLYDKNKDLVDFLISRHMDHTKSVFSNSFLLDYFENGKLKNDRKIKLLLILMWADMLGRAGSPNTDQGVNLLIRSSEKSKIKNNVRKSNPFKGSSEDFRLMLKSRGLSDAEIEKAIKAKFG
jgi:hypothetical protein